MATHYLYGTILTGEAVAANNRGDNLGNTTTLQKVFHQDDVHTSVSAEAIRFALRYRFQLELGEAKTNRTYHPEIGRIKFKDDNWETWKPSPETVLIDDDLMGFMNAAAAKKEKESEQVEADLFGDEEKEQPKGKGKKPKGTYFRRPSPLAIGRAISLRRYRGELSYNSAVRKDIAGKAGGLSLYNAEMHTTEYQYSFGLNLDDVIDKANVSHLVDAIIDPPQVAGNHARFAFDFSPASIVLRVTNAHSSRIQNCFEHDADKRTFTVAKLIKRVASGDVPAAELIIGGEVVETEDGKRLAEAGVAVFSGVRAAAEEARKRIAQIGAEFAAVNQ